MRGSVQQYWREIRALEEALPAFVWLVAAAAGAPPIVTEVSAQVAAKLLHARSHRIAEKNEIDTHCAQEAAIVKQAKRERMRKSGSAVVVVDGED